jgi:SAM domain (Sterile alpha motif)
MDIEAWLQGLGLERYLPAFRDNEIDWEVLPKLTSDDLKEIGLQQSATGASCWKLLPRSASRCRRRSPRHSTHRLLPRPSGAS